MGALVWVLCEPALAADLVVVVDDLGYNRELAERVLALPPVTLALMPFAPATAQIAKRALATGHELILHQPMEPLPAAHGHPALGTLTADMSAEQFDAEVESALQAVPGAVGVNNHTGSLLTQDPAAMRRLMHCLARRGLLFLDSRTTPATVAYAMAREAHVPALKRDVFLDHVPKTEAIRAEFERALAIARRNGHAVIIAHPYPASLNFLEVTLRRLPEDVSLTTLARLAGRDHRTALVRQQTPASPHRSLGQ